MVLADLDAACVAESSIAAAAAVTLSDTTGAVRSKKVLGVGFWLWALPWALPWALDLGPWTLGLGLIVHPRPQITLGPHDL